MRFTIWKSFDIRGLEDMVVKMMQRENQSAIPTMAEGGLSVALA